MTEPQIDMGLAAAAKAILEPLEARDTSNTKIFATAMAFGVAASNQALNAGSPDAAPVSFTRAFLRVLIDPLDPDLDHLRADPASGAVARAARMKRGA